MAADMPVTRKLAAIMFSDMVGYTAMMQKNELQAKTNRDRFRHVLEDAVARGGGHILQYYGDGALSLFNSAVEAVEAGVFIQNEMQADPVLPLRLGIHSGDVVQDGEGVYGDGVNIAARIEGMAVPGAVLVSGKVYDEIKNHPQLPAASLGTFELKNVDRPVRIYAITSEGLIRPKREDLKGKGQQTTKSIAVLPFVNMSADPENEYFSDGISEEILNALVKVENLKVTSRTSSFAFKGQNLDVREIGSQLNVETVLEGSVRRAGNRVRITAQLINTADGYHTWSEVYDREIEDIFAVQDEISRHIANQLRARLTGAMEQLVTRSTDNLEAYNNYLKGLYHLNKWTPEGARQGIGFFEAALQLEPEFALPHASLAYCYTMLGSTGQSSPKMVFPKAKEHAQQALKLDNSLAESHLALGLVHIFLDWDLDKAKPLVLKAQAISPGSADVYHGLAIYYLARRQNEKAIEMIKKAVELNPLSLPINAHMAEALAQAGHYTEALEQVEKTMEIDPTFRPILEAKGWIYVMMERYAEAVEVFEEKKKLIAHPLKGLYDLGFAYARAGMQEQALECLAKLKERQEQEPDGVFFIDFALLYMGLNDTEKMFEYLDLALNERTSLMFVMSFALFDPYRDDPRFIALTKKHGLKTY